MKAKTRTIKKARPLSSTRATLIAVFTAGMFVVGSYILYRSGILETRRMMADDVTKLATILKNIDDTAGIIGFDSQKNIIDFLNVKSFAGSEVGTMNLADPLKWQGPYLEKNLSMQDVYYQIVRARDGFYIVPGDGVKLANGAIMGKDVVITPEQDISAFITPDSALVYMNRLLIAPVQVGGVVPPL